MHFKIIEYWLCKKPLVLYSNETIFTFLSYVSHSKSFNYKLAKLSLQNEFYALQKLKLSLFWYTVERFLHTL